MKKNLLNPLENHSAVKLLIIGLAFTVLGSALAAIFQARFDGVIDLHFSESLWWRPAVDNLINITSLSVSLLLAGFYFNKKTRAIDILAISVLCRYPLYILPLFNINSFLLDLDEKFKTALGNESFPDLSAMELTGFIIFIIITLLALVWFLINLYNGFSIAAHAKGNRAVFAFVLAIILAEIISKIGISIINI